MNSVTRTTCPYCGVGCGVLARRDGAGAIEITGDPDHPANRGKLCSKGSALAETLGLNGRLLHPKVRGERAAWSDALESVASGFRRIIDQHGPHSVAFYVSGQLLTEDYYVANKLMKGFIGTANIDTNSRLCMSSAVAGHKRAFGEDVVPLSYEDLGLADLIVLVGSNTAWCHPIVFQRMLEAKQERPEMKIVVIDPRRTATCEFADVHLPINAGTDVWLFNGLLAFLNQHGAVATQFVAQHTKGMNRAIVVAENTAGDPRAVAKICGIDERQLLDFYGLFARTDKTITMFSQGVNQSSSGTDKVNAIINCHLLTGRIGQPGAGPFSITGQPNAMGGREVGGLANMLAAHMDLENSAHREAVQKFWNSPTIASRAGLKAVEMFDAIHDGRIKAVWVMATNPVVSLPDADKVKEALRRCELVVVSDCEENTDTNVFAHVLLPAIGWGEKDGTVTNSDRHISRQRAFMPSAGEAKPDWWIISEVARRMGFAGFDYESARDIFVEHATLSGVQNEGTRAFDISALRWIDRAGYDRFEPTQWPIKDDARSGTSRLCTEGRFYHPDRKARFVPTTPRRPKHRTDEEFPWVLNTGRIRDQWHTMTRSGKSPKLSSHIAEPFVDMHAQDALLTGARAGDLVRVTTKWGSLIARLKITGEMPRGMIFVPIHWSEVFASDARAGALVNPVVDPVSGEPELKHTPARVAPFVVSWHGFILTRTPLANLDVTWWTVMHGQQFTRYELAGRRVHGDWSQWARRLFNATDGDADWIEYSDPNAGAYRGVLMKDNRLAACVFLSPRPELPSRTWLASLFARDRITDAERGALLVGHAVDPQADVGPTVCSCFGVGRTTICNTIKKFKLTTPQQVGQKLKAGTNCGSCVAEIKVLLSEARERE